MTYKSPHDLSPPTRVKATIPTGRKKGSQNISTKLAQEALAEFVDQNSSKIQTWLDEVYEKHGAKAALECLSTFIEYRVPKLSRVEHQGEQHTEVIIRWDDQ